MKYEIVWGLTNTDLELYNTKGYIRITVNLSKNKQIIFIFETIESILKELYERTIKDGYLISNSTDGFLGNHIDRNALLGCNTVIVPEFTKEIIFNTIDSILNNYDLSTL